MKRVNVDEPRTWEDYINSFVKLLPKVEPARDPKEIFCDVCRIFSLSLRGVATLDEKEKECIESQYMTFVEKYGKDGMEKVSVLFAYVIEALEKRRCDFLGQIYERLNATVKAFAQFLTPLSVARLMAHVTFVDGKPEHGKIISMDDPACGAGALLIEAAEAFIESGGRQGDLFIHGEDLDATACCISYVQFTLLGYPAVVRRMDTLAMKVMEGPWYTMGYFAHGMPMRLLAEHMGKKDETEVDETREEAVKKDAEPPELDKPINVRELVQGEFEF